MNLFGDLDDGESAPPKPIPMRALIPTGTLQADRMTPVLGVGRLAGIRAGNHSKECRIISGSWHSKEAVKIYMATHVPTPSVESSGAGASSSAWRPGASVATSRRHAQRANAKARARSASFANREEGEWSDDSTASLNKRARSFGI